MMKLRELLDAMVEKLVSKTDRALSVMGRGLGGWRHRRLKMGWNKWYSEAQKRVGMHAAMLFNQSIIMLAAWETWQRSMIDSSSGVGAYMKALEHFKEGSLPMSWHKWVLHAEEGIYKHEKHEAAAMRWQISSQGKAFNTFIANMRKASREAEQMKIVILRTQGIYLEDTFAWWKKLGRLQNAHERNGLQKCLDVDMAPLMLMIKHAVQMEDQGDYLLSIADKEILEETEKIVKEAREALKSWDWDEDEMKGYREDLESLIPIFNTIYWDSQKYIVEQYKAALTVWSNVEVARAYRKWMEMCSSKLEREMVHSTMMLWKLACALESWREFYTWRIDTVATAHHILVYWVHRYLYNAWYTWREEEQVIIEEKMKIEIVLRHWTCHWLNIGWCGWRCLMSVERRKEAIILLGCRLYLNHKETLVMKCWRKIVKQRRSLQRSWDKAIESWEKNSMFKTLENWNIFSLTRQQRQLDLEEELTSSEKSIQEGFKILNKAKEASKHDDTPHLIRTEACMDRVESMSERVHELRFKLDRVRVHGLAENSIGSAQERLMKLCEVESHYSETNHDRDKMEEVGAALGFILDKIPCHAVLPSSLDIDAFRARNHSILSLEEILKQATTHLKLMKEHPLDPDNLKVRKKIMAERETLKVITKQMKETFSTHFSMEGSREVSSRSKIPPTEISSPRIEIKPKVKKRVLIEEVMGRSKPILRQASAVIELYDSNPNSNSRNALVDENHCRICKDEFGTFKWKHRCKQCNAPVCDACSPMQKLMNGGKVPFRRVCDECAENSPSPRFIRKMYSEKVAAERAALEEIASEELMMGMVESMMLEGVEEVVEQVFDELLDQDSETENTECSEASHMTEVDSKAWSDWLYLRLETLESNLSDIESRYDKAVMMALYVRVALRAMKKEDAEEGNVGDEEAKLDMMVKKLCRTSHDSDVGVDFEIKKVLQASLPYGKFLWTMLPGMWKNWIEATILHNFAIGFPLRKKAESLIKAWLKWSTTYDRHLRSQELYHRAHHKRNRQDLLKIAWKKWEDVVVALISGKEIRRISSHMETSKNKIRQLEEQLISLEVDMH